MIDLYTWATPNGRKVSIALEEMQLEYRVHAVHIGNNEQFAPEFLAISPNNKIPALVDHETSTSLMESGAILMYLADKSGAFQGESKWLTLQWLMLQMASVGPMFGQTHHFHKYNPGVSEYAESRYLNETHRLYGVLNTRLGVSEFLAGQDYSIADMATFPWIARWPWHSIDWVNYPHVARWYSALAARPGVQRGYAVPESDQHIELPQA